MFKKLFGGFGKKNDGFYLQMEDDTNTPKPPAQAKSQPPAAEKVAKVVAEPTVTPVTATTATPAAKSTKSDLTAGKEAAKADKDVVIAEKDAAKADKAAKKSAKKAESNKKTKSDPKVEQPTAPVFAPAALSAPITNFATDYLIKPSSISTRRRPGANMNMFLDMARQAKKPVNIK
jgi:hypothetical protein